jgi:site-specific DNA recombinase
MTATTKIRKNGNGVVMKPPATVRVAIYCRVSDDDRLGQEFNSLDAQRESIEAYVRSQRGSGWAALPDRFDDGGFTGANTERPAFKRLMAAIEAGGVDVVAVYKIDRLSRSLVDFVKVMETFDHKGVRFVSVTQAFDTSTSMGRLVLNILMSFAEFERQVISERTRDKLAATKRKGFWCGGRPVLGYDAIDKKLVVNQAEAERVREIMQLFLDFGSLVATLEELERRGWKNKAGGIYNKDTLRRLLTNPLYLGKVSYLDEIHDGVHDRIIDQELWDSVQHQLQHPPREHRGGTNKWGALLTGISRCGTCGAALSHHFSKRGNRCYSYYVCQTQQKQGAARCPGSRVSTTELEEYVVERIRDIGRDPALVSEATKAARKELDAKKPQYIAELRCIEQEAKKLAGERKNLLDAVANGGPGVATLMGRIGELDDLLQKGAARAAEARGELTALESRVIDESDLREALASFIPVWQQLFPKEKSRILRLLVERVEYHAADGKVEIVFRPGGVRAMAREAKKPG